MPSMPGMYNYNPPLPGQSRARSVPSQPSTAQPPIPGFESTTIPGLVDQGVMGAHSINQGVGTSAQPKTPIPPTKNSFKLRRTIAPKPPVTVLMELVGGKSTITWKFIDNPEDLEIDYDMIDEAGQLFTCQVTVDGMEYIGTASSKNDAKNACAENAVKDIIHQKCEEGYYGSNEDPVPWASLASLALFKLYNDWQSQGYIMPPDLTGIPGVPQASNVRTKGAGGLLGPTDKHPVQLLNEKNGKAVEYEMKAKVGEGPTAVFVMTCTIEDTTFTGEARNKKDAKKACALKVLKEKYDITYPGE